MSAKNSKSQHDQLSIMHTLYSLNFSLCEALLILLVVRMVRSFFVILPINYSDSSPKKEQVFIKTDKPSLALAKICRIIYGDLFSSPVRGIDPTALVHESAVIEDNVFWNRRYLGLFVL